MVAMAGRAVAVAVAAIPVPVAQVTLAAVEITMVRMARVARELASHLLLLGMGEVVLMVHRVGLESSTPEAVMMMVQVVVLGYRLVRAAPLVAEAPAQPVATAALRPVAAIQLIPLITVGVVVASKHRGAQAVEVVTMVVRKMEMSCLFRSSVVLAAVLEMQRTTPFLVQVPKAVLAAVAVVPSSLRAFEILRCLMEISPQMVGPVRMPIRPHSLPLAGAEVPAVLSAFAQEIP